jgi:vacuolar-type H+-ATPase catalytic subunit A/Vma1
LLLIIYPLLYIYLQRPLKTIAIKSGDVYIPRGVSVPALDKDVQWEFQPNKFGNDFYSTCNVLNIRHTICFTL